MQEKDRIEEPAKLRDDYILMSGGEVPDTRRNLRTEKKLK